MNIAVLLHSGAGGSGVVATELGLALAKQGHNIHFVSERIPFRLTELSHPNVYYHEVASMMYPLFESPLTTLSEASKLTEVIEEYGIHVIHAHYAIPHATAAILARDMAQVKPRPVVVTTLHGTDVTLVGLDRAYLRTTQYSIENSDLVTAVSKYLADYTRQEMGVRRNIQVIPNAVDHNRFSPKELHPKDSAQLRLRYAHPDEKLLLHISNFRPIKRIEDVIRIFAQVSEKVGARLLMVGDGPDRSSAFELASELGISGRVAFLGSFPRIEDLLSVCDLFLLPSTQESFGLAALEAMASGVPVVASNIGGIPEVVQDGLNGFLFKPYDVNGMAQAAIKLLSNDELHQQFSKAARACAVKNFSDVNIVPMYMKAYEEALERRFVSNGK